VCVNSPRPSALLSSLSKSLHTSLVPCLPNITVMKAMTPPPHHTIAKGFSSMEELPSNSLGSHLLTTTSPLTQLQGHAHPFSHFSLPASEGADLPYSGGRLFDMEDLDRCFVDLPLAKPLPQDESLVEMRDLDEILALTSSLMSYQTEPSAFPFSPAFPGVHSSVSPLRQASVSPSHVEAPLPSQPPLGTASKVVKRRRATVKVESSPPASSSEARIKVEGAGDFPSLPLLPTLPSRARVSFGEGKEEESEERMSVQKRKSCEASARYRQKKQKEEDDTKASVGRLASQNQALTKKVEELQAYINKIETEKAVLKAKLEVYEGKQQRS